MSQSFAKLFHTKALTLVYQQKIRMNDGLRCVWRLCSAHIVGAVSVVSNR